MPLLVTTSALSLSAIRPLIVPLLFSVTRAAIGLERIDGTAQRASIVYLRARARVDRRTIGAAVERAARGEIDNCAGCGSDGQAIRRRRTVGARQKNANRAAGAGCDDAGRRRSGSGHACSDHIHCAPAVREDAAAVVTGGRNRPGGRNGYGAGPR